MYNKTKRLLTLPLINVIKYYVDHHVSGPDEKLVSNIQLFFFVQNFFLLKETRFAVFIFKLKLKLI